MGRLAGERGRIACTGRERPAVTPDVLEVRAFYEAPLGAVAGRLVGRVLAATWPDLRGLRLLGIGYPEPYLPGGAAGCERVLSFMPAAQGAVGSSAGSASGASALVDLLCLPLPEACLDRILVVHALETVESPAEFLAELSRVMAPNGRVILVCPNRRGLWARLDTTPFGHGQPFSRTQLRRLLRRCALADERWAETLYVPPLRSRMLLRGAGVWERVGTGLGLPFAGLHVVEAVKSVAQPEPVRSRGQVRRRLPNLLPVPASGAAL